MEETSRIHITALTTIPIPAMAPTGGQQTTELENKNFPSLKHY